MPAQPINTAPSAPESSMPIYNTPAKDAATQNKSVEDLTAADINKTATQDIPVEDPAVAEIPIVEPKPIADKPAKVVRQAQVEKQEFTDIERVSTLPGIDLSVHAYSDKIAEGARLAAITPDGIVVDFGNRRVLLGRIR